MKNFFSYSKLESDVNKLTPRWVVNTGILNEKFGWMPVVTFKNKIVRRAKFQENKWTISNNTHAYPDFMILPKRVYLDFQRYEDLASKGYNNIDIFNKKIVSTTLYLEVFGDYFHSGERIQGISKEEHQKEVEAAYASAGYSVLVLWENEINNNWDDVCLPKINKFLKESGEEFEDWNINKLTYNNDLVFSLKNSEYWRELDHNKKEEVITTLVNNYSQTGFPIPERSHVRYDLRRFTKWLEGSRRKETIFGNTVLRLYIQSILDAKVNKSKCLREIWEDKDLMRKCIHWQLENENGRHNANRFLNAMCSSIGFRIVSSMSPGKVVRIINNDSSKGGIFFDPCAGWGGRLLGACSLGMKYIGIDANKKLVDELNLMKNDLNLDAEIYYGDSSDPDMVNRILNGRKIDLCFTSPPYYNKEIYSEDEFQSIKNKKDKEEWIDGFLIKMIDNVMMNLNGKFILNLPVDFNCGCLSNYGIEEKNIEMRHNKRMVKEKLIFISKIRDDKIVCQICGKQKSKLGIHIKKVHNIEIEEYKKLYGNHVVSDSLSKVISNKLKERTGMKYSKRIAYKLPSGRIVRRKEVWMKAWNNTPPFDSILTGEEYIIYKNEIKNKRVEGVDYVRCAICGYESSNISRHLRREHNIEPKKYTEKYKKEVCCSVFKLNRYNPWTKIEKKEKDIKQIRRKFTREELFQLYQVDLLTDKQISEIYKMTPEGILYQRRKFGIPSIKPLERERIRGEKALLV